MNDDKLLLKKKGVPKAIVFTIVAVVVQWKCFIRKNQKT